ncbi:MAG: hypothetical protein V1782_01370, partial [Pseudomonadota bacterium]
LTHMRWVDTFAHAFGQSEIHHAGNLIPTRSIDQAGYKTNPGVLVKMSEDFLERLRHSRQRLSRLHGVQNLL